MIDRELERELYFLYKFVDFYLNSETSDHDLKFAIRCSIIDKLNLLGEKYGETKKSNEE